MNGLTSMTDKWILEHPPTTTPPTNSVYFWFPTNRRGIVFSSTVLSLRLSTNKLNNFTLTVSSFILIRASICIIPELYLIWYEHKVFCSRQGLNLLTPWQLDDYFFWAEWWHQDSPLSKTTSRFVPDVFQAILLHWPGAPVRVSFFWKSRWTPIWTSWFPVSTRGTTPEERGSGPVMGFLRGRRFYLNW